MADLTNNERVAAEAERILGPGPMSFEVRHDEHAAWLDAAYGHGAQLLKDIYNSTGTECAVFAGGCLIHAALQAPRSRPRTPAILTWLGVHGWEGDRSWRSLADLEAHGGPLRGDIPYWAGGPGMSAASWKAAFNGHVGITLADGWVVPTAEGGGSPKGTGCRMSDKPKDIRSSWGRPLRGVWRPNAMGEVTVPEVKTTWRRGDHEPRDLHDGPIHVLQRIVGTKDDGGFGPITEAAVKAWEAVRGIKVDGVWGLDNQAEANKP